jgi:hypothetical protein
MAAPDEINLLKHKFAKKYDIPEFAIDEGLFPIYKAFSFLEEDIKAILEENTRANKELAEKVQNSIVTISYKDHHEKSTLLISTVSGMCQLARSLSRRCCISIYLRSVAPGTVYTAPPLGCHCVANS